MKFFLTIMIISILGSTAFSWFVQIQAILTETNRQVAIQKNPQA